MIKALPQWFYSIIALWWTLSSELSQSIQSSSLPAVMHTAAETWPSYLCIPTSPWWLGRWWASTGSPNMSMCLVVRRCPTITSSSVPACSTRWEHETIRVFKRFITHFWWHCILKCLYWILYVSRDAVGSVSYWCWCEPACHKQPAAGSVHPSQIHWAHPVQPLHPQRPPRLHGCSPLAVCQLCGAGG